MPAAIEGHVPAWKRLGLKLKHEHAPEEPAPATPISLDLLTTQKKRKSEYEESNIDGSHSSKKPEKKSKKSKDKDQAATVTTNTLQSTALPSTAPRKSVSFSPETKTEDGDSAKDLYNTWIASQKASDPAFDPSSFNQDALKSITPPSVKSAAQKTNTPLNSAPSPSSTPSETTRKTTKKKKKKKKKKKRNKSKSTTLPSTTTATTSQPSPKPSPATSPSTNPSTTHPALTYLHTHHTSPSTWKFSKSRSSYLLRHLFSPPHIPLSHDEALKPYLEALQSQNAKQRLVEQAVQIQKEDEEWLNKDDAFEEGWTGIRSGGKNMDDPRKRREVFLRAVAEYETLLREREEWKEEAEKDRVWRERIERRRRAEMVLGIFGDEVAVREQLEQKPTTMNGTNGANGVTAGQKQPPLPNGGGKPKPKRKRKRRTTGVADDESTSSSSSSSSSESSSSSDDDDDRGAKRMKGGTGAARVNGHAVDLSAESTSGGETNENDTSSSGSSESDSSSDD